MFFLFFFPPSSLSPTANKALPFRRFFLSLSLSLWLPPPFSLSLSLSLTFPLSLPPPAGPWLKKPCSPPPPPLAGLHGAALHGKRGNEEETDEAATLVRDSLILLRSAELGLFFSLSLSLSLSHRFPPTVRPRATVLVLSRPSFSRPLLCTHTRARTDRQDFSFLFLLSHPRRRLGCVRRAGDADEAERNESTKQQNASA